MVVVVLDFVGHIIGDHTDIGTEVVVAKTEVGVRKPNGIRQLSREPFGNGIIVKVHFVLRVR
ncbi:hypothetical protein D3C81_1728900 [compost metagenome]